MRVLGRGEDEVLAGHIVRKGQGQQASQPLADSDDANAFADFVRLRFQEPLAANGWAGPAYGRAFTAMSVVTIAAGLASSTIVTASGDSALSTALTVLVAGLGILVSVLAAVTQIWRPAQRSVARYQAAYALRREGWDYVHDLGRYEEQESGKSRAAFMTEVNRIHRGVEVIDESISDAAPADAAAAP